MQTTKTDQNADAQADSSIRWAHTSKGTFFFVFFFFFFCFFSLYGPYGDTYLRRPYSQKHKEKYSLAMVVSWKRSKTGDRVWIHVY